MTPELDWLGVGLEDGSYYAARRHENGIYARVADAQNVTHLLWSSTGCNHATQVLGQGTLKRDYNVSETTGNATAIASLVSTYVRLCRRLLRSGPVYRGC